MSGSRFLGKILKNNAAIVALFTKQDTELSMDDFNSNAGGTSGLQTAQEAILRIPKMKLEYLKDYSLLYVATPYELYPEGRVAAFIAAAKVTSQLINKGLKVLSPICHGHPIHYWGVAADPNKPIDWLQYDEAYMAKSDGLIVCMMDSWEKSKGIEHETHWFMDHNKPVFYLDMKTVELI